MKLDDIKKLHQKKYRAELGCFLVEGEHLILELQKAAKTNPLLAAATLYASDSYGEVETDFELLRISDKHMQKISDTKSPQGIVAVVPMSAVAAPLKTADEKHTIYLHEIQDPGNLGTILRTLAWFGGFKCVLSPSSVDPYNPKVVRASMGAIFHVPIELDISLPTLQTRFDAFACLDTAGTALSAPQFSRHQCFVFGNEARGVPREQLAELGAESFSIQGNGVLESLNLATAVNMCAYELNRSLNL
ncbi:TrmH family RNA methyltransferase [Gilvimarinus polysaccharolyticus]|uniref:TrmH family RNA methyltransferase n=1 Tax=Gilvimarinus polysaccharolyticus TaxID=863921 RepID=UPI0006734D93|nr:RNA methyltransferase [Gilvimarinus polysaccharolyticus]